MCIGRKWSAMVIGGWLDMWEHIMNVSISAGQSLLQWPIKIIIIIIIILIALTINHNIIINHSQQ